MTVMVLAKDKNVKFKWWYFALAFLVTLPITAYLLRQNNLKMLELRDKVVAIDQKDGDIKKIEPALEELRDYVLTHMNASLPSPLELPGSFNVSVERARKKAEASGTANGDIYKQAQAQCERVEVPLSIRAECIQNYVTANAKPGSDVKPLDIPPKEQFVYNFVSPTWSFDHAGLMALVSSVLFVASVVLLATQFAFPKLTSYILKQPLE